MADLVVSVSIWVSISCTSNKTRESGVLRSKGVSDGLLVNVTKLFAKDVGEKLGSRKAS